MHPPGPGLAGPMVRSRIACRPSRQRETQSYRIEHRGAGRTPTTAGRRRSARPLARRAKPRQDCTGLRGSATSGGIAAPLQRGAHRPSMAGFRVALSDWSSIGQPSMNPLRHVEPCETHSKSSHALCDSSERLSRSCVKTFRRVDGPRVTFFARNAPIVPPLLHCQSAHHRIAYRRSSLGIIRPSTLSLRTT